MPSADRSLEYCLAVALPPQAVLVRLDDAGMSVQMAEYVCHALIRHFREFDAYEADAREGRWSFRKPREREDFSVGVMGLGVLGERVAKAVAQFEFPVNGSRMEKLAKTMLESVEERHGWCASRLRVQNAPNREARALPGRAVGLETPPS